MASEEEGKFCVITVLPFLITLEATPAVVPPMDLIAFYSLAARPLGLKGTSGVEIMA